jgi:hypothetical protein
MRNMASKIMKRNISDPSTKDTIWTSLYIPKLN